MSNEMFQGETEFQRMYQEKDRLDALLEETLAPVYEEIVDVVEKGTVKANDLLFYTDREDGPTDYIIYKKDEYNTVMCVAMAETLAEKLLDQLGIAPREGWSPCDGW